MRDEQELDIPQWVNEGGREGPTKAAGQPKGPSTLVTYTTTTRGNVGGDISRPVQIAAVLAVLMALGVVCLYTAVG
jgi:preprotein translocase subunit SecF